MTEPDSSNHTRRCSLAQLISSTWHLRTPLTRFVAVGAIGLFLCAWVSIHSLTGIAALVIVGAVAGTSLYRSRRGKRAHDRTITPRVHSGGRLIVNSGSEWNRIAAAIPDILLLVEADGSITYANRAIGEMSVERLVKSSLLDSVRNSDRGRLQQAIADALASGRPTLCEVSKPTPDGSTQWWRYRMNPVNDNGPAAQCLVLVSDITEDRDAQSAFWRMNDIVESTSDLVAVASADFRILQMNRAGRRLLGWDDDAEQVTRWIRDCHPDWAMRRIELEAMPIVLAKGIWEGETALIGATGEEIPVSQVLMAHRSDSGRLEFLSTIIRDISERKRSEAALREGEQRLFNIVQSSPMGIHLYEEDAHGRLLLRTANPAAVKLFGTDAHERIGALVEDVLPSTMGPECADRFARAAGDGIPWSAEYAQYDGAELVQAIEVVAFQTKPGAMAAIYHDHTEHKRAEEVIRGRLNALTRPIGETSSHLAFTDLFDMDEIQRLQDAFATSVGMAAVITDTEGRAITKPSNLRHLCQDIVATTKLGRKDCAISHSTICRLDRRGPIIHQCPSGGLWDAGASICVGDHHIASWLVGQVRDSDCDDASMTAYARRIGADEQQFREALAQVPAMSISRFRSICDTVFLLANQLSRQAYRNVQQARAIADRKYAEQELREREQRTQRQQAAILRLLTDRSLFDLSLDEAAAVTTEIAGEVIGAQRAGVWLFSEGRSVLRCVDFFELSTAKHSSGQELRAVDYPHYFAALESQRALDVHDAQSDSRTAEFVDAYLKPLGITSMLDAAIRRDGEVVGVVCLEHVGPARRWQIDEIAFAGAVADQVTLMLVAQDRRRTEQELRESEEMFREITELAPAAIFEADLTGRVVFANRKSLEYFGFAAEEVARGFTVTDVVSFKDRPRAAESFQRLLTTGKTSTSEYLAVRKNGGTFPMSVHVAAILRDGRVVGVRGIIVDITEQKRSEQEMLKSQRLDSMGVLAGGIAHDFNNLLTGILGNISLVKMDVTDPEIAESLEEAERAAIQAQSLTNQLLTFSKGGAPVKTAVAVNQVVRDAVSFALRGSDIRAEYDLADNLPTAEIDTAQIHQVLHNITINADQAMPDGGTITVSTEVVRIDTGDSVPVEAGDYVCVSVRDHGVGMTQQQLPKVFDPYYTTKPDGNGLGLATSYSIVKKHHGHISVESEIGVGSVFRIYLPVLSDGLPDRASQPASIARSSGKVLVLDDDKSILRLYYRTLTRNGFKVDCIAHSSEAIRRFQQAVQTGEPYDAVIVDLTIPGDVGGEETVRRLREIGPGVKALICSGYPNNAAMSDYAGHGFQGVVAKPFRPDELVRALHQAIHGEGAEANRSMEIPGQPASGGRR